MGKTSTFAMLTAIACLLAGCAKTYSDKDVHWLTVPEARAALADSSGSWFSQPRPNTWVDPRDALQFRVGHIPGALNVRLSDPGAFDRLAGFGLVVVYADGYKAPLADAMVKALLKAGMKDVKGLETGYEGWLEAGEPFDRGDDEARVTAVKQVDRWQRQPVEE